MYIHMPNIYIYILYIYAYINRLLYIYYPSPMKYLKEMMQHQNQKLFSNQAAIVAMPQNFSPQGSYLSSSNSWGNNRADGDSERSPLASARKP